FKEKPFTGPAIRIIRAIRILVRTHMLKGCRDRVRIGERVSLVSPYHYRYHTAHKERTFNGTALLASALMGIDRVVSDRGKVECHSGNRHVPRCVAGGPLYEFQVP